MRLPTEIREALADGEIDLVESAWIERAEIKPYDLQWFNPVAKALIDRNEEPLARTLLELLDDQLQTGRYWNERLDLIREHGKHWIKTGHIFETVMESVRNLYSEQPEKLDQVLGIVGLDGERDDTPKLWDKIERTRNLFAYTPGTIVYMEGKGVGRVESVNLALATLKVDFEKVKNLSVGFRAAGTMLEPLPEGHVLRRKIEEPETLSSLDPAELLRTVMASYERALTAAEVREAVSGLVPEKKWSSWWTAARKHPQVVVESGKKQAYRWAESATHAEDALWAEFEKAKPKTRLDLLRRASNQDAELRARMAGVMEQDGKKLATSDPALAFETWQALDRIGHSPSEWTPATLVKQKGKPPHLWISRLGTRSLRELAYRETRNEREDWANSLESAFLREEDPKALEVLLDLLAEDSPEARQRVLDQAVSQPRKTPAQFTFVAERAANDEELRDRRGLRLLKQILTSLSDPNFDSFHGRLGVLCDTGGTVPRLLGHLTPEQAADAEKAFEEANGLEDYRRAPLLEAIRLRFPTLRRQEESPLYTTQANLEAKHAELQDLAEKEIPANRKAIEVAREMGDLRENFEYKAARQRHEYLTARATELAQQIERALALDPETIDTDQVRPGTRVDLSAGDETRTITILGPWESDPENGVISFESELAEALIGGKVGDQVSVSGTEMTIDSIEAWE